QDALVLSLNWTSGMLKMFTLLTYKLLVIPTNFLVRSQFALVVVHMQLVLQFAKDEGITLGGAHSAQVLLARDTRPTGEYLLDVATKGISAIVGSVALDMGILTTPQLHWMVRNKNRGLKASEADYFTQITESFRSFVIPARVISHGEHCIIC
uniref:Alpha-D-phosphohexomutase alpha/beta/alpha domain-containing protein n=1 Tax=Aegilops tauschii subsp. strangulata TaxID=200361 RepID=A0A453R877_AEGTS